MARSFDYVVVGAGSAGAVVASRLSEDADISVLLLEAGGTDRHPLQLMPLAFQQVIRSRAYNWGFESEPEPGLYGRRLPVPRGRTLGGSSSINALICIRGNPRDYDLWRQQGLAGWGYADVLPYFRRLESHWRGDGPYHGGDGPVRVTPMDHPDMLYEPMRQAAAAAGIPANDDPNGASQEGISRMEATIGAGRRVSTARAYLRPAMARSNLTIETGALTSRIAVEKGRAVGVEYIRAGKRQEVRAEREVVLSAGTYNSPQILMLSGIGPPDHLASVGIVPRHDLPGVGQNLSEHPNILNVYRARDQAGLTKFLRWDRAVLHAARWFLRHDGPFASNGAAANVFLRSRPGLERPDVQLTVMTVSNSAALWIPGMTAPPLYCFSTRIGALHPQSRGFVRLASNNPQDKPRIWFNMFAAEEDLSTMIRGVRACRDIFRHSPLREMTDGEISPGPDVTSDEALADAIRRNAGHRSHPVGTCRMGADAGAVVDAQLRVRGIERLRVVDASVMPETPSGNTNVPCIMIGEKAADMLRGRSLPPAAVPEPVLETA
ncbi:MAG: GMC family oxidoreductase N-terminal domain-containing protein [Xanthobacteraceae bacterium]